jgi:hypothetical protein
MELARRFPGDEGGAEKTTGTPFARGNLPTTGTPLQTVSPHAFLYVNPEWDAFWYSWPPTAFWTDEGHA